MTEPDVNRDETHHCQAMRERDSLARRLSVRWGELDEARAALRQMTDERDAARAEVERLRAKCAPTYDDAEVELFARAGFEHSGMHQWEDITDHMREEWRSVARKQLSVLTALDPAVTVPSPVPRTTDTDKID